MKQSCLYMYYIFQLNKTKIFAIIYLKRKNVFLVEIIGNRFIDQNKNEFS